ncbi:MAG: glycosyltransferase family 2 protein [Bacteroidaceae bacterium]|nr:glycosyltransferase family 2 protein [Bacteroidaceae bacterium]
MKNNLTHRLAIIIPAYKAAFLPAALDSIAAQTCKDFTLYVGDDCSTEPIGDIVEQYRDKIELVYQRFDLNLGGKDLVAQWERCIAMSKDEPYIWLFSDDDMMEPKCVEQLFKTIDATQGIYDLYHFDVKEINEEGTVTKALPEYPQVLSAYDYYKGKTAGRYRSYVVENVFTRKIYEEIGGFKNFDLAWGSDVATWCIFCGSTGMCKISDAHVCWRRSNQNITPDKSRKTAERKLMAECDFVAWAYAYFKEKSDILPVNKALFIRKMMEYRKRVGWKCYQTAFATFFRVHGHRENKLLLWLYLNLTPIKLYHLLKKNE